LLALGVVAVSAACASSGTSYQPSGPERFDNWAQSKNVRPAGHTRTAAAPSAPIR
jgi:hypothetical protein